MKPPVKILFFTFVFCSQIDLTAQNSPSFKFPEEDLDSVLFELARIFPTDWSIESNGSTFLMTKKDTLLFTIQIYRCCTFRTQNLDSPPPLPIYKIKFQLKLEVQPLWTAGRIMQSQKDNEEISAEIAKLPAKYKILIFHRMKDDGYDIDRSDSAKAVAFLKEEKELKSKFQRKPSFSSKNYSFFVQENFPNAGFGCYPIEDSIPIDKRIRKLEERIKETLKEL